MIDNCINDCYKQVINACDINVFKAIAKKKNYNIFSNGNDNINIWGIRCNIEDTKHFNDLMVVFYKHNDSNPNINGKWTFDWYSITTDPSDMNLIKPINSKGCAILKEGQYKSSFKIGLHKGYKALVQVKALPLYRDNNKDSNIDLDESKVDIELAGINIHRASKWKISRLIGLYSAGCQVFESVRCFEDNFMPIVETSSKLYGNSFTYTLINLSDIYESIN